MKRCRHCEVEITLAPHPTTKKLVWQHHNTDPHRRLPKLTVMCRGGKPAEPEFNLSGLLVIPYGEDVVPLGENVRGVKLIKMDAAGVTIELYT